MRIAAAAQGQPNLHPQSIQRVHSACNQDLKPLNEFLRQSSWLRPHYHFEYLDMASRDILQKAIWIHDFTRSDMLHAGCSGWRSGHRKLEFLCQDHLSSTNSHLLPSPTNQSTLAVSRDYILCSLSLTAAVNSIQRRIKRQDNIVSVLHQNKGRGKSWRQRGWIYQHLPSFGYMLCYNQSFPTAAAEDERMKFERMFQQHLIFLRRLDWTKWWGAF